MTYEQMMNVSIFDCENEKQLKEKNKLAREKALEEYRLYQAYHNNPLKKEYLEKRQKIESMSEQKPSYKFRSNITKYLIFSTIIYGLIFIISFSEDYNEIGTVFFVLALINIVFFIFAVIAEGFIDKVINFIFPNENRYDDEKNKLLNELYKEYMDKGLRLDYSSTTIFCPANYTYYYGLREKYAPNGHKYFVASQDYRCAITDSPKSDDEYDDEKQEWQYLPCETRFWCNGCKNKN